MSQLFSAFVRVLFVCAACTPAVQHAATFVGRLSLWFSRYLHNHETWVRLGSQLRLPPQQHDISFDVRQQHLECVWHWKDMRRQGLVSECVRRGASGGAATTSRGTVVRVATTWRRCCRSGGQRA